MTRIVLLSLLAGCVPPSIVAIAEDRLQVRGRRLHLETYERMGDSDVYVFCRRETGREHGVSLGPRTYDAACITLVCPAGDDGPHCR